MSIENTKAKQEAERVTKHSEINIPTEDLVASIIARPGSYDACLLGLAHAYESQRERIADLEDDVEQLRPKYKFKPETLFQHDSGNAHLLIDTDIDGGLCIDSTDLSTDNSVVTMLAVEQGTELATALAKWAGVDGVRWTPIVDGQKTEGKVLLMDGDFISAGHTSIMCGWNWPGIRPPTHWAPLPKPPESP